MSEDQRLDQWHVLGVGAMGGLYAHRLAALGYAVTLLSRDASSSDSTSASIEAREITLVTPEKSLSRRFQQQPISAAAGIRRLLVTTKSFDVVTAITSVLGHLSDEAEVVIMANGMGYHDQVAKLIAPASVIAGTTTAGCHQPDPNTRVVAGVGETKLGWLSSPVACAPPTWFGTWAGAEWPCVWEDNINAAMINKLALNAVINPITALANVPNGELLRPKLRPTTFAAIEEVQALLRWSGQAELAADLPNTVIKVIKDTALNTSSMRSDVNAGRPTEVDAILGYLLQQLAPASGDQPRPPTPGLQESFRMLRRLAPDRG